MRTRMLKWCAVGVAAIAAGAGSGWWTVPNTSVAALQAKAPADEWKQELFPIPEESDPEKLVEFLEELSERDEEFKTPQQQRTFQVRRMLTQIAVGDRILKIKKLTDEQAEKAALLKLQGHINLAMLGVDGAPEKAFAVVKSLAKDPRPVVVQFAKNNDQLVRIILVTALSPEERTDLIKDVLAEVKTKKLAQRSLRKAQMLGESLAESGDTEQVAGLYEQLAALMTESGNENLAAQAQRIEGQVRRLRLPGNFLDLQATTLEGKKFDWAAYRGKVVLVDFWATWCGPCLEELPNVKENYEKYHAKGFEVVGISLDEDQEELERFLKKEEIRWTTLFEPKEQNRGWEHPLAIRYGVTGIPQAILVDKEGKVITLMARGPDLGELLEEHLGK